MIKRFIAGVVCPSCGARDTTRMFSQNGSEVRECVDCGFSDVIEEEVPLKERTGEIPKTRISHEQEEPDEVDVQVVRILDSKSLH